MEQLRPESGVLAGTCSELHIACLLAPTASPAQVPIGAALPVAPRSVLSPATESGETCALASFKSGVSELAFLLISPDARAAPGAPAQGAKKERAARAARPFRLGLRSSDWRRFSFARSRVWSTALPN